jgi:ABC-type antimicrobial peptide transport system permease subunit
VIQFGNMDGDVRPFTVVGVVGDVREASLASEPRPTFYGSWRQRPRKAATMHIVVRGDGAPAATIAATRRIVREVRPDAPARIRPIEEVVAESVADRRFVLSLIGAFGAAALVLAVLGVYSVLSFLVSQRRQELTIRVALGARAADIARLVVREGASLALAGIVVGAAAALALARAMSGLLFGVSAADPLSFAAVMLVLGGVALLASLVPARRAARVEPMGVLRGA